MWRRLVHGAFWFKVIPIVLVVRFGMSHRDSSLLTAAIVTVVIVKHLIEGHREQYWEPEDQQYARHWENLVWGNSRWLNPETPDQGVDRLVGPWRPPLPEQRAPHELEDR